MYPQPTPDQPSSLNGDPVWALAAQLTSGMLANPSKAHFTVKDSLSLFDEILAELQVYARVRGDFASYAAAQQPAPDQNRERQQAYLEKLQSPKIQLPGLANSTTAATPVAPAVPVGPQQPAPPNGNEGYMLSPPAASDAPGGTGMQYGLPVPPIAGVMRHDDNAAGGNPA